ncbi:trypsin-like serine peptidase, partial [Allosphingosinicella sp.]|uniref:trypsin-like serine peptidase n=1 Tax=Allosphingosinicella sp. TaxID=2823234 RepID=UPI002F09B44E
MASTAFDPHAPVSNLTKEDKPQQEELSEPETGTEEGVAEAEGEVEMGAQAPAMEWAPADGPVEAPDTAGLRDVGTASFEEPSASMETVHGPDNRTQITDTATYPFRAIASLLITARDGSQYVGTGWFISPRTLITAGHCVYIKRSGRESRDGWVKTIQVMPGRNGSMLPFQSVTSSQFFTVRGWADNGDESYDYGA